MAEVKYTEEILSHWTGVNISPRLQTGMYIGKLGGWCTSPSWHLCIDQKRSSTIVSHKIYYGIWQTSGHCL